MTVEVNPKMVSLARQARGLTQTELARRLDYGQGTISKMEQGLLPVSDEMLARLSTVLEYPVSFFRQAGHVHGPGIKYNRARKSLPARVRDRLDAQHNIFALHLKALLSDAEFDVRVPSLPVDQLGSPETVAQALREYWQVPRGPIPNLTRLLENNGFVVIQYDFGTKKWDGVHLKFPDAPPMMFVNELVSGDRMRFTKAHELGHRVMHDVPKEPDAMDEEANRFAAEFLMPAEDIKAHLQSADLVRLAGLKRVWGVSMQAMLHTGKRIGAISEGRYRYIWSQIIRAGWAHSEPDSIAVPKEQPSLRGEIIATYMKSMGYSVESLSQKLHIQEQEFYRLYTSPHERLRRVK